MRKLPTTFKAHPDLRSLLEAEAATSHLTVSELIQVILVKHYESGLPTGTYAHLKAHGRAQAQK